MNAPVFAEVLVRRADDPQIDLPLAAEDVLRCVWEGRFGTMLIEVRDGRACVNGQAVTPRSCRMPQPTRARECSRARRAR